MSIDPIRKKWIFQSLTLCAALIWLAGCVAAPPPTVHTRHAPEVDFTSFRTFAFAPQNTPAHRPATKRARQWIRNDVIRALQARGYTHPAPGVAPDLLVSIRLSAHPRAHGAPNGAPGMSRSDWTRGWAAGPGPTHGSTRSTRLTVYLIREADKNVIWSGTAVWPQPPRAIEAHAGLIHQGVTGIFTRFPVQPPRSSAAHAH